MRRCLVAVATTALASAWAADISMRGGIQQSDPIDPMMVCLLAIGEDKFYDSESGKIISTVPVQRDIFASGVFIQERRSQEKCSMGEIDSGICFEHTTGEKGRIVCELCRFSEGIMDKSFEVLPCRREVSDIARRCLQEPCIHGDGQNGAKAKRNMIVADNALGSDESKWMESLHIKGLMQGIVLNDLVLPGSHNSAAVSLSSGLHCGRVDLQLDSFANEVAQNQDLPIDSQLKMGIRFFDLRVIENTSFEGKEYPLHHTYLVKDRIDTLYKAFDAIDEFLRVRPFETVVVRVDGYTDCKEEGKDHTAFWTKDILRRQRFELLASEHLSTNLVDLKGMALVDVDRINIKEDWPGSGFGAHTRDDEEGPFKYGQFYKNKVGDRNKFTLWPFMPNIDASDAVYTVMNPLFEGLEDWDVPYMHHMWMMDSLIGLRANEVNAIMTDRVGKTPVYDVATRLTLYRIFDKRLLPQWDSVPTHEYINAKEEEFEHHCPPKFALQGFASEHHNWVGDRRWKFVCRRVDWLDPQSYCGGSNGWQKRQYHPSAFSDDYDFMMGSVNDYDDDIRFWWEDGSYAITGMGSKFSDWREDRKWYFYASQVTKATTECSWTSFVNRFDGLMDYQTGKDEWVAGIMSTHSNWRQDRRWKFYVCH